MFDIDEPVVSELFKGKKFRDAAKNTCPSDKQVREKTLRFTSLVNKRNALII